MKRSSIKKKPSIKVEYRKVSNIGLSEGTNYLYGGVDRKGKEYVTRAVVKLDPILKKRKYEKLRKSIIKHEKDEIAVRMKSSRPISGSEKDIAKAHKVASSKQANWFKKEYNEMMKDRIMHSRDKRVSSQYDKGGNLIRRKFQ